MLVVRSMFFETRERRCRFRVDCNNGGSVVMDLEGNNGSKIGLR